jgi:hypothetical protein
MIISIDDEEGRVLLPIFPLPPQADDFQDGMVVAHAVALSGYQADLRGRTRAGPTSIDGSSPFSAAAV